jgi:hypothetical protein
MLDLRTLKNVGDHEALLGDPTKLGGVLVTSTGLGFHRGEDMRWNPWSQLSGVVYDAYKQVRGIQSDSATNLTFIWASGEISETGSAIAPAKSINALYATATERSRKQVFENALRLAGFYGAARFGSVIVGKDGLRSIGAPDKLVPYSKVEKLFLVNGVWTVNRKHRAGLVSTAVARTPNIDVLSAVVHEMRAGARIVSQWQPTPLMTTAFESLFLDRSDGAGETLWVDLHRGGRRSALRRSHVDATLAPVRQVCRVFLNDDESRAALDESRQQYAFGLPFFGLVDEDPLMSFHMHTDGSHANSGAVVFRVGPVVCALGVAPGPGKPIADIILPLARAARRRIATVVAQHE